ncbi:MAG TPA: hypothetical protein VG604_01565, partial [Candidatus Saccharimonadales bacterium]|nr:hypothetical protein [Candidatus Saccharimonadales bacterium]
VMSRFKLFSNFLAALAAISVVGISVLPAAAAAKSPAAKTSTSSKTSDQKIIQSVTQSYNADASVQVGMIVELKAKSPDTVIPVPQGDIQAMLGIVIPESSANIVLTPEKVTQQQVLVATSGHYNVLVTSQNGPIKVGDYITVSAISGLGMKASQNELEVVGKAAGNFSGSSDVIGSVKLKDSLGKQISVNIGRIPVDIAVSHNPLYSKSVDYVPGFLAKIAVTVANHPISAARIYLSMALMLITAFITANMLYSGVRSGMIAVGRNPLSKKSIIRSLIQTVIAGLIIFVVGIFAVYLLLKL